MLPPLAKTAPRRPLPARRARPGRAPQCRPRTDPIVPQNGAGGNPPAADFTALSGCGREGERKPATSPGGSSPGRWEWPPSARPCAGREGSGSSHGLGPSSAPVCPSCASLPAGDQRREPAACTVAADRRHARRCWLWLEGDAHRLTHGLASATVCRLQGGRGSCPAGWRRGGAVLEEIERHRRG